MVSIQIALERDIENLGDEHGHGGGGHDHEESGHGHGHGDSDGHGGGHAQLSEKNHSHDAVVRSNDVHGSADGADTQKLLERVKKMEFEYQALANRARYLEDEHAAILKSLAGNATGYVANSTASTAAGKVTAVGNGSPASNLGHLSALPAGDHHLSMDPSEGVPWRTPRKAP